MEEVNIKIGSKKYKVKLAESDEELSTGLQNVENLPEDEGMLFIMKEPDEVSFWMKDTKIPLDIIFLDEELEVISVHEGIPESEEFITEENVNFVLEVNKNSGIKSGDDLDFISDASVKTDIMLVIDPSGKVQMELDGEERIFSRPHTKTLIKFAKKAYKSNKESDYKNLGKRLFKFLKIQSETKEEYVEKK